MTIFFERRPNGRFYECASQQDVTDGLTEYFRIRAAKQRGGRARTAAKQHASRINGRKHISKKAAQRSK